MLIPFCANHGVDSLSSFVKNNPVHDASFADDFRQGALEAIDFASDTLRNHPQQGPDASDLMDDLRNSLQALEQIPLKVRDANLVRAREQVTAANASRAMSTPDGPRPLLPAADEVKPALQDLQNGTVITPALLARGDQKPVQKVTVHYGPESAQLYDNLEPGDRDIMAALKNGTETLGAANQTTPLVQGVLAAGNQGNEELRIRALTSLQHLRDLLSDMRSMPSHGISFAVTRPVTEDAVLHYCNLLGSHTRTAPVHWYQPDGATQINVVDYFGRLPDLPDYVLMK